MRSTRRARNRAFFTATLAAALLDLGSPPGTAAMSVQGVTFPDTATVAGTPVKLNGMGVRVAFVFVKVYVAGLYLATPTHDGQAAVATDEPKRILLHLLREITHIEMIEAMKEGFAVTGAPALQPRIDQFSGFFTRPMAEGTQVQIDYAPSQGTTVSIGGIAAGTVPGADFMQALFAIWLGPKPADAPLEAALLGSS